MIEILEVDELSTKLRSKIQDIVKNNFFRFSSYYYGLSVTPEKYSAWITNELENVLLNQNILFLASEGSNPIGIISLSMLEHDSKIFSMKMAKLHHAFADVSSYHLERQILSRLVQFSLKTCKKLQIRHVSTNANTFQLPLLHSLQQRAFLIMSSQVKYRFDARKTGLPNMQYKCHLREAKDHEANLIAQLSENNFRSYFDRFHSDPELEKDRSDLLFYKWAFNSCRGFADRVIVAECDEQLLAFATLRYNRPLSNLLELTVLDIVLNAVDAKFSKRGIYTNMIHYALTSALSGSNELAHIVEIGTQINNYPAQQVWSNLGFRLVDSNYNLHKKVP